jgi:KDO2-lipid IV(A) lauroyltransferase
MRCWSLRPLVWLAQAIARLPQPALLQLAWLLTFLGWWPLARRRRIAATNLALCFPELDARARRRLLRRNVHATVMGVIEMIRSWFGDRDALQRLTTIDGLPALREALDEGRGILLLISHVTTVELSVRLLSDALGRRVRGIIRRNNSPCVEAELERARSRTFLPTLEKKDLRGLMRSLKGGEVVVYAGDQDFSYRSEFVPFFGVPAATLAGTAEIVARGDARMFVLWSRRDGDGRYHLRVEPAWSGWAEAGPAQAAAMYMRALEAQVRAAPEQYLWVHRRFKTRPPGEPSPYA